MRSIFGFCLFHFYSFSFYGESVFLFSTCCVGSSCRNKEKFRVNSSDNNSSKRFRPQNMETRVSLCRSQAHSSLFSGYWQFIIIKNYDALKFIKTNQWLQFSILIMNEIEKLVCLKVETVSKQRLIIQFVIQSALLLQSLKYQLKAGTDCEHQNVR